MGTLRKEAAYLGDSLSSHVYILGTPGSIAATRDTEQGRMRLNEHDMRVANASVDREGFFDSKRKHAEKADAARARRSEAASAAGEGLELRGGGEGSGNPGEGAFEHDRPDLGDDGGRSENFLRRGSRVLILCEILLMKLINI